MTDIAWNFTGDTLRDGSPIPPIGHTLIYSGEIKLCATGYHWSPTPWDAAVCDPGPLLHKVRVGGLVITGKERGVSSEITILASIDATKLILRFAADQALSVAHLWDMPDIVREYLTTLDSEKREGAFAAARATHAAAFAARVPRAAKAAATVAAVTANVPIAVAWKAEQSVMWAVHAVTEATLGPQPCAAEKELFHKSLKEAAADFNARVYRAFEAEGRS